MVRLKPLTRLRLGFAVLGALLLGPLGLLWSTANQRLETQRRLRHEVVGERIFDELERELTDLLDRESRRPSAAYDGTTRPDSWAPFVVGYFTVKQGEAHVVASTDLPEERRQRMEWAIGRWQGRGPARASLGEPPVHANPEPSRTRRAAPSEGFAREPAPLPPAPSEVKSQAVPRTSPEILRQLNRGEEVRQRAPASDKQEMDPLGY